MHVELLDDAALILCYVDVDGVSCRYAHMRRTLAHAVIEDLLSSANRFPIRTASCVSNLCRLATNYDSPGCGHGARTVAWAD